jgi:hypothetical protein
MSSQNKFLSVLTLTEGNGTDSVFEHHEYPGLWRYAEIKLGTFAGSARSSEMRESQKQTVAVQTDLDDLPFTFTRWVVKYPFDSTESSFVSSSSMLNNVWKLCRDTLLHTSLDTFTDSNTRER